MSLIQEATQLLTNSHDLAPEKRWYLPFPMGVFGTLRDKQCNNGLMHKGKVALQRKAFMPHFLASGLSISFSKGCTAPFDVFFYDKDQWDAMIPRVDRLESFSPPNNSMGSQSWWGYYYRTLAYLHLLPEDFEHKLFTDVNLGRDRDLRIKEEDWQKYERIPCWVYSSKRQNEAAQHSGTIIWG